MLVKNMRNIMASVAGVAVATSAMGEGNSGVKADVYGELRMEATYHNDGLATVETEDGEAKPRFRIGTAADAGGVHNHENQEVRFGVRGSLNDRTTFNLQLNGATLQNETSAQVHASAATEVASITWRASDMISLSLGKDYVHQGGFSNLDNTFSNIWGMREQTIAFDRYANSIDFHYAPNEAHTIAVQFVNDVTALDGANHNTTQMRPSMILEYTGKFGTIEPLFQYGMFDDNTSNFMDIGARASFGQTALTFDYGTVAVASADKDKSASHNNMTLRVEHDMGSYKPFFWYNSFSRTDKEIQTDDKEVETNTKGQWDDNATQISLGTSFNMGDHFTPYVAYRMKSGDFVDPADATKKKSGSEGELGLGVLAHF